MQIRFDCPTEKCVAVIELQPLEEAGDSIRCPRCGREHPVEIDEAVRERLEVNRCVVCRCEELFVRKDFPQFFGLAVVVVAGVISFATLKSHPLIAYGVLLAAVLLDLGLYLLIGKVTACYACRAEYRGAKIQPDRPGFDLATAEKY
ncbi:MAG: hypothetical protein GY778_24525 [bacterium]|nr:hypothetical protein [bacterium]